MNYIINVYELSDDGHVVSNAFETIGPFPSRAAARRYVVADVARRDGERMTALGRHNWSFESYRRGTAGRLYQYRFVVSKLLRPDEA